MTDTDTPDVIRVAVADDHPLMREGIVQALRKAADIEVVAEGQSADDALEIARRLQPDVMLLDVNMPGDGIEAVRRISAAHPDISCVMISVREDEDTVSRALKSWCARVCPQRHQWRRTRADRTHHQSR